MLNDDITVLLESSSRYAVIEYNDEVEDPEGCTHDAIIAVSLTGATAKEFGGTRAVKMGEM